MECGVACVTDGIGITRMHLWFVDNLDIQLQVRMIECTLAFPMVLIFKCRSLLYELCCVVNI